MCACVRVCVCVCIITRTYSMCVGWTGVLLPSQNNSYIISHCVLPVLPRLFALTRLKSLSLLSADVSSSLSFYGRICVSRAELSIKPDSTVSSAEFNGTVELSVNDCVVYLFFDLIFSNLDLQVDHFVFKHANL